MILRVSIVTPDRIFLNVDAEEIVLPTSTGQMGVLTNHTPLITALDVGVMLFRNKKEWISVALMGGFALVKQNKITVLVNEAESSETIDPSEAKEAFSSAKKQLDDALNQKQKVEANFNYKRARARYQVIQ